MKTGSASQAETITIAVAGNPNTGKSTLINSLAGSRLQVGNWAGVTVEKKEARMVHDGQPLRLVDLPGTYSLSPYTQEEVIARDYLVQERPEVIIDVVDATNLERNLYLTVQLLELGRPVVIALNFFDEVQKKGLHLDIPALEKALGVTVVPTVATRGEGLPELLAAAVAAGRNGGARRPRQLAYHDDLEQAVQSLEAFLLAQHPALAQRYPLRWLAYKIVEGDQAALRTANLGPEVETWQQTVPALRHLRRGHDDDLEGLVAEARYGAAAGVAREVVRHPRWSAVELTEKIDRIVLNRVLGIPIFLFIMWLMFKLTFDLGNPFVDWVDGVFSGPLTRWTAAALTALAAPAWLVSLATEGVIGGVGMVLTFIPLIFAMMFFITLLEGSGYMARAAFVMDRAMHLLGLHGKSFIPLLLGFGCNVPAIYATRTLENPQDKVLTALLIPFMSCGARLPVYVLFAGLFFADQAGTVIWGLYVLGLVLAMLLGIALKRVLFRGEAPLFIMELPPYRLPRLRHLLLHTWEKGKHFLLKAGTYILAIAVLMWFLLNLPWGVEQKQDSLLGKIGQGAAPLLQPLGFGSWEAGASLISGLLAKEVVISTMGQIYAVEEKEKDAPTFLEDVTEIGTSFGAALLQAGSNLVSTFGVASLAPEEDEKTGTWRERLREQFTPLGALAFMVFTLFYMPCLVTAVAYKHEFGTWKWFGLAVVLGLGSGYLTALLVYQGGRLLGLGG